MKVETKEAIRKELADRDLLARYSGYVALRLGGEIDHEKWLGFVEGFLAERRKEGEPEVSWGSR